MKVKVNGKPETKAEVQLKYLRKVIHINDIHKVKATVVKSCCGNNGERRSGHTYKITTQRVLHFFKQRVGTLSIYFVTFITTGVTAF